MAFTKRVRTLEITIIIIIIIHQKLLYNIFKNKNCSCCKFAPIPRTPSKWDSKVDITPLRENTNA